MEEKFLAFTPYRSGLGNVIMSYECALALSYITKRKLLLAPTAYMLFIETKDKRNNHSFWDLFDRETTHQEFDIEDYHTHANFQDKFTKIQTQHSWLENLSKVVEDCYEWKVDRTKTIYNLTSSGICFVVNKDEYKDSEDFRSFVHKREVIDLNVSQQYLLFENNLFQNYWYLVYPGGPSERNKLKDKINKVLRYKQYYYDLFESTLMNQIGSYNAVHVRRNDFFIQFGQFLKTIDSGDKLLNQLLRVFDTDKPLYIATDENDLSFFKSVKDTYKNVYFFNDIKGDFNNLTKVILDQIICSRADEFYGTKASTFTRRINVMRGLENRITHDNTGINMLDKIQTESGFFPWHSMYHNEWSWADSAYLQWTKENVS